MTCKPLALIYHDQPHVQSTLAYLVQHTAQFNVAAVGGVTQACHLMTNRPVGLVVMDALSLDDAQRAAACQSLRQAWRDATPAGDPQSLSAVASQAGDAPPAGEIWLISTRASSLDLEAARDLGADRILTTPLDPDLVQRLAWDLGQRWGRQLAMAS